MSLCSMWECGNASLAAGGWECENVRMPASPQAGGNSAERGCRCAPCVSAEQIANPEHNYCLNHGLLVLKDYTDFMPKHMNTIIV